MGIRTSHRTEVLAFVAVLLAIYLSVSTMDYQDAIEAENADLKSQVKKLKAQVADPPKLCHEYYRQQLKLKKGKGDPK